jgi:hypothetical protein
MSKLAVEPIFLAVDAIFLSSCSVSSFLQKKNLTQQPVKPTQTLLKKITSIKSAKEPYI